MTNPEVEKWSTYIKVFAALIVVGGIALTIAEGIQNPAFVWLGLLYILLGCFGFYAGLVRRPVPARVYLIFMLVLAILVAILYIISIAVVGALADRVCDSDNLSKSECDRVKSIMLIFGIIALILHVFCCISCLYCARRYYIALRADYQLLVDHHHHHHHEQPAVAVVYAQPQPVYAAPPAYTYPSYGVAPPANVPANP